MIDPYAPPPGHPWDCPCDECQECRERFAAGGPMISESLIYSDREDGDDE